MPGIQNIYSVNVSNRYELQDSDSDADYDPLDTLKNLEDQRKRAEDEAKKKKQQALATNKGKNQKKGTRFQEIKDSNVPAKREQPVATSKTTKPKGERGEAPRNDRRNYPGGDENRRPPRRRNDQPTNPVKAGEGDLIRTRKEEQPFGNYGRPAGEKKERVERYQGGRGGYRNFGNTGYRGRGSGGYRNDGRDDRGKRVFDRRSGSDRSGVRPTDKRDGAGPRNWGTPGKELEEAADEGQLEVEDPGNRPEQPGNEDKEAPKEEPKSEEEKEVKEEKPIEMTLDEWKAKQAAQPKNPSFNIRKPGEGENTDQWKNMKMLRKTNKDEGQHGNVYKEQHKHQAKPQVSMNIQFGDNAARGFGRGRPRSDRGYDRGARGQRGYSDRQRGHQMLPDVQNEQEFPTLG